MVVRSLRIVDNGGHGTEGDATYIRRTGVAVFPRRLRGSLARAVYVGHTGRNAAALRSDLRASGVEESQLHRKRGHGERFAIAEHHRDRRGPQRHLRVRDDGNGRAWRGEGARHRRRRQAGGGRGLPGDPLRIVTQVYPEEAPGSEDEEKVDLQIKVAEGEEVRGLRYKATMIARTSPYEVADSVRELGTR